MRKRIWPVLLASGLGLALLLSLGVWQVMRLAEKQALLAVIDRSLQSAPMPLDDAIAQFLNGKSIDYIKVKTTGSFAPREPLRLLSSSSAGPSWTLVHAFQQPNGTAVLVNRGKLDHDKPLPVLTSIPVEIVGHVQWHDKGRGVFDVDNKPEENLWYWWDVVAMTNEFSATHLNPNYIVVNLVPGSPGTEGLQVDAPKANLRNNHLGYAITWFGLAAVLVVMTAVFVRQMRRPS
jgi:surfeit locus 1 family protein